MLLLSTIRRFFWIVPVVLGIIFIAAGGYMFSEGRSAKDEVRSTLAAEQITTSSDASIPGVLVDSPATAQSQAELIHEHILTSGGGKPYATMDRYVSADGKGTTSDAKLAKLDASGNAVANPARTTVLNGDSLRTALNLAVMGFKVSDLVMGLGAFLVVVGLTNVFVLAPVVYWLRQPEAGTEKATGRQPVTPPSGLPAPMGG